MVDLSGFELARLFAETAKLLAAPDSFGAAVEDIVTLAVSVVPGAEAAGLSLARNGTVETPAATDDLARACDAAQYETGEGPCLQAVWEDRILRIEDMTTETRWPKFAARAAELGARSLLACHLSSERGSLSALNLYARESKAFDDQSRSIALIYAAHATIALESARLESDLRGAIETRQGIGQAIGIVMERHQLTPKGAFDLLVRASQKLNIKLRELADVVVTTGVDPIDTSELARHAAQVDGSGDNSSRRPEIEAKLAAADAHERAATLHDKQAAQGRAEVAEHERQAEEHRRAAAAARTDAQADTQSMA